MKPTIPVSAPTSSPTLLTNREIADRLRTIGRQRAARHHGSCYQARAFYRAAQVVAGLCDSLECEIRAGLDATRHPFIGPGIARELRLMINGEDFGQLEFPLRYGRKLPEPEAA